MLKADHKPLSLQVWSSTKRIWTQHCSHIMNILANKSYQLHSSFDLPAAEITEHNKITKLTAIKSRQHNWKPQTWNIDILKYAKSLNHKFTSWNIQSKIQNVWPGPATFFVLAPFGKADGKQCKIRPLRSLLTVVPLEETTRHRLPAGLGKTYLFTKLQTNMKPIPSTTERKWKQYRYVSVSIYP